MEIEDALIQLSFHSGRNESIDDPRWANGFLGSLRPFKTLDLVEKNFHSVVNCLRALFPYIQRNNQLDKQLVNDITTIIHFGRAWGVHEDGMLRRNNLISPKEVEQLDQWLECISSVWCMILVTEDESLAFEAYNSSYS
jgi:hypothetical protein